MGHTATPKIIYYRDDKTGTFKTTTHVVYDEAYMTLAREKVPPEAIALQNLGYANEGSKGNKRGDPYLHVQLLSKDAKLPTKGTAHSVGLDLYSAAEVVLSPQAITIVPTDIAI